MAVYKRGYQRYQGPLTGHWARLLSLPRFSWERLFQQRLVVLLLTASLIWPLLCGMFIYLSNHLEIFASLTNNRGQDGGLAKFMEINARFFLIFMNAQSVFSVMLAAMAGPGLIAPDLANNALPLYLSRPLTRKDYVLARLLVLVGLLSTVTWIPGLTLFGIQSGMAGWSWMMDHLRMAGALLLGFFLWILMVSLVALACSAYVKWKIVAGALVLGFFFVTAGVASMVNAVFRVDWGVLLNPAKAMYVVWSDMLGADPPDGPGSLACAAALLVLVGLLGLVLERKLRPVEVIK
ncbi:ABC transporter permease subunit [Paludibaculum fermentans]|uniref:ABC transporter permease subunit n=1 Tax=Paludibaculum fermentans TaxID=1473598 RepID=A0A7S7NSC0_PALFE|nr:ABC transporter permease subunit [Paludibaculum fermentans]QOY88811.1 ABC transporter permease subunit [Paludibaculum fermentans]